MKTAQATGTSAEAPKHTPTPWEVDLVDCMGFDARGIRIFDCNNEEEAVSFEQQEANAAFIIRAVNSHEELLAALKNLRYAADTAKALPETILAIGRADAAIAKAEGRA